VRLNPVQFQTLVEVGDTLTGKPTGTGLGFFAYFVVRSSSVFACLAPWREPRAAQADQAGSTQGTIWRL